ncbi:uncharacterized protein LOC143909140 [Arctopsyche grandis]|uniref:uncharacterized protein LOC143909140 n=1 Tax=Arctopsyche grandis TaxID=121162 RepID=UPI00406DA3FB
MLKFNIKCLFLIQQLACFALANLEGPFIFWGPKELLSYKRPSLVSLEQDDLMDIYNNQGAIVVFNIQDSLFFLTRESYPRLRKLLERKPVLIAPQDFLDVHPEYVNNETQVITVQGPNSEQDAEITEKFERLEDVYGEGKVLAILGSSTPEEEPTDDESDSLDYSSDQKSYLRDKREFNEEPKEAPEEVVYNALGKALLYSSDFPILRYSSGDNETSDKIYKLRNLVGVTGDDREQFSRLVIVFGTEMGKVTLRLRFPDSLAGYWNLGPIELLDPRGRELLLNPPTTDVFLGAPRGFSFTCAEPLIFSNGSVSLTFLEIQVQPLLNGAMRFGSAYNCVGFTTVPIWTGIFISMILIFGMTVAIAMISDIKTMDKFENSKGKTLTISVVD